VSLFDEILKGLPVNPLLREKVAELEAKYAATETENAILRDDLRDAKAENQKLKKQIEELSHKDDINDFEIGVLKTIADIGVDNFASDYATQWFPGTSAAKLEYHLQRLDDAGYCTVVYGDNSGSHYAPTQKGLELLVQKDLI